MLVQPAALRADLTQAVARITHVSLADLLGSMGGNARERQTFTDLLRNNGTLAARVLETRADGMSVLELVNARVALRLAAAHAPGELVTLALDDSATATAPAAAPAAAVKLSAPAMLLNEIQKPFLNQALNKISIGGSAIAMVDSAAAPQALADALQHAVRTSGLFYESHLHGWVDGRVTLESLFEEPQAQVTESPPQRKGEASQAQETARSQPEPLVHPKLEPLVRQQLETFERQSIAWQGYLWPGQQGDILISGEPHSAAATQAPRTWRVQLALDTPTLGQVKADITLNGRRLNLRLEGEGAAANVLCARRAALAHALAAHDLDVNPIHVAGAAP